MNRKIKLVYLKIGLAILIFTLSLFIPSESTGLSVEAIRVIALGNLMVFLWLTEAVPMPVTALLPIVLFPVLGVMSVKEATAPFASSVIFLFLGGFILALAIEKWQLHKRIALLILYKLGADNKSIIAGMMISTALISMWISNTATTVIMLPIGLSLIETLSKSTGTTSRKMALGVLLSIAYSANMGGIGTLIGTPPNVILAGFYKSIYNQEIDFLQWMMVGIPIVIITLVPIYFIITTLFCRGLESDTSATKLLVEQELKGMGKMGKAEKRVFAVFALTVFLWIAKSWINSLVGSSILSNSSIAVISSILLFVVPVSQDKSDFILKWEDTKQLSWGILLFFGGALSLANGLKITGIIDFVGEQVKDMSDVDPFILVGVCVAGMLFLTEFMGSTALTTVFVPVIFGLAEGMDIPVLDLAVPVIIATSGAFMFPMATPPNAIVFSSGYIKVKDMARVGFLMNLLCVLIVWLIGTQLTKYFF